MVVKFLYSAIVNFRTIADNSKIIAINSRTIAVSCNYFIIKKLDTYDEVFGFKPIID